MLVVVFMCTFPSGCHFESGWSGQPLCATVSPAHRSPPPARQPTERLLLHGGLAYWLHFHWNFMLILPKVHFEKVFRYVL